MSLCYMQKILACPSYPAYNCAQPSLVSHLFEKKPRVVCPLCLRLWSEPLSVPIDRFLDHSSFIQDTRPVTPWDSVPIPCDWNLAKYLQEACYFFHSFGWDVLKVQTGNEGYCEIYCGLPMGRNLPYVWVVLYFPRSLSASNGFLCVPAFLQPNSGVRYGY